MATLGDIDRLLWLTFGWYVGEIRQEVALQLARHCVMLARSPGEEDEPIKLTHVVGSGTPIQVSVGNERVHYGVLTCGHVLGAFEKPVSDSRDGSLTLMTMSNKSTGKSPPSGLEIGYCNEIAVTVGSRNQASTGPDLGWLHLSSEQARVLQDAGSSGAVFYNITLGLRRLEAFRAGPLG